MIPTWIDPIAWDAFVDMRKKIKAPLTPYAASLIVRELVKLKSSGESPQDCLDQSIRNSWRDVFPVRDKQMRVSVNAAPTAAQNDVYERQLAASIAAMGRK
jgi:hypothetical protein